MEISTIAAKVAALHLANEGPSPFDNKSLQSLIQQLKAKEFNEELPEFEMLQNSLGKANDAMAMADEAVAFLRQIDRSLHTVGLNGSPLNVKLNALIEDFQTLGKQAVEQRNFIEEAITVTSP